MKTIQTIVIVLVTLVGAFFLGRQCSPTKIEHIISEKIDTVEVRDTVFLPVPEPTIVYKLKVDTVRLQTTTKDTVWVEVPMELKVYQTKDYRAEVSGFRPKLEKIEIYPVTKYITKEITTSYPVKSKWGVGLQVGYGIGVTQNQVRTFPYIGVGVSYNLWTW